MAHNYRLSAASDHLGCMLCILHIWYIYGDLRSLTCWMLVKGYIFPGLAACPCWYTCFSGLTTPATASPSFHTFSNGVCLSTWDV